MRVQTDMPRLNHKSRSVSVFLLSLPFDCYRVACPPLDSPATSCFIVHFIRGNGLRVHFKALKSALVAHPKSPNRHNVGLDVSIAGKILELILDNPTATMAEMVERLGVTKRTVEREVKQLRKTGRIERIGSKRFGHWKINN